jgi:hypothetical protein
MSNEREFTAAQRMIGDFSPKFVELRLFATSDATSINGSYEFPVTL